MARWNASASNSGNGPFRFTKPGGGQIGGAGDGGSSSPGLRDGVGRTITQAHHHQRIGKPGHAQGRCGAWLIASSARWGKRDREGVNDIVHHPHGHARRSSSACGQMRAGVNGSVDQPAG